MLKKVMLLAFFGLLLVFLGCANGNNNHIEENNKTKSKKTNIINKNIDKNSSNETIEETFLNEMGFNFKGEKIILDLNKTKNFFSRIRKKMENKVKEIKDINVTKESGVIITKNRVDIDLNSTKNLLNSISSLFKSIILDTNNSIK